MDAFHALHDGATHTIMSGTLKKGGKLIQTLRKSGLLTCHNDMLGIAFHTLQFFSISSPQVYE